MELELAKSFRKGNLHGDSAQKGKDDLIRCEKEAASQLFKDDKRVNDMTDVELANVMDKEISEYTDDISDSLPRDQYDTISIEITPCQNEDLGKDCIGCRTNQNMKNIEGETVPNKCNHPGALNIPTQSFATKSDSLSVHALQVKEDKTELKVLSSSKQLICSPNTRRPDPSKSDFAAVRMPDDEKTSILHNEDSWIRAAIPYLPVRVAVLCLLLNIVIPGSGTIVSGFCILCCARPRVPPKYDQDIVLLLCTNTLVGLAQLFTVTFLLVGWFWSAAWGIRMVILSFEYKHILKEERTIRLKKQAINAFKSIR